MKENTRISVAARRDRQQVMKLRTYYRKHFPPGDSDRYFLYWVANVLVAIREDLKVPDFLKDLEEIVAGSGP